VTHPALAAQWHPTKNGNLTPAEILAGTGKRIWWLCDQGPDHEWLAIGADRVAGNGCPACFGRQASVTNNLNNYPELAAQFHPTKNGGLTPADVAAGTGKKVWWICDKGSDHEWLATGDQRRRGSGCPSCAGQQVSITNNLNNYPDLAAQFHPTKNGGLAATGVVAGTHRKLWWGCDLGPDHEWLATGSNRLQGRGCPFCAGQRVSITNDLNNYPDLAAQFHPTKNGDLTPADVVAGTSKKVWWICDKGPDHEWQAAGSTRLAGNGCRSCAGHQASVTNDLNIYPELAAQLHPTKNGDLTPAHIVAGTHRMLWWVCDRRQEHEWQAPGERRLAGSGCPSCAVFGYSPAKDAWIYLINHPGWHLQQVGITNDAERRLKEHQRDGWEVRDLRGPMDGALAQSWERSVLTMLRSRGIHQDSTTDGGKFSGYTESWRAAEFDVASIRELMDFVYDDELDQGSS